MQQRHMNWIVRVKDSFPARKVLGKCIGEAWLPCTSSAPVMSGRATEKPNLLVLQANDLDLCVKHEIAMDFPAI